MPGFRHSPLDDIQRIRQDLRDRYADGFPILKELLQNSDDAGAGTPGNEAAHLVVALCKDGLPGSEHPLLQGAGIVILNDGAFTEDDAESITSLGLSNKAGQTGAAGKFGLGLKSIFHWAEAFFYFSSADFGQGEPSQASSSDLLNPWWSRYAKEGRHPEWDETWKKTREVDVEAFRKFVGKCLGTRRWFGLWIPLRQEAHCRDSKGEVQPIEQRFPESDPDALLGSGWRPRLAETLPLLRRVRIVKGTSKNSVYRK